MVAISQEEFLQLAGMTTFHFKIFVMASLAQMADGAMINVLPLVSAWMQCEFKVSAMTTSLMNTSLYLMRALGIALRGKLADRYGRVKTLIFFLLLAVWSCLTFAMSPTLFWVIIHRSLMGFSSGGLGVKFMIEYFSMHHRKMFVLVRESFCLGGMYTILVSYLLIKQSGWRTIMVLMAVLPFLSCAMAWSLPEPPRFLMVCGKVKEAVRSMKYIYAAAREKRTSLDESVMVMMGNQSRHAPTSFSFKTLFSKENFSVTMILMLLRFACGFLDTGVVMLSVTYFRETYRSESTVSQVQCSQCNHLALKYYSDQISYGAGCASGGVISFLLVDRLGRRKVMLVMLSILTLCWFCLSLWSAQINLFILFFLLRLACTGFGNACSFYVAELYSTSIRERSTSLLDVVRTLGDLSSIGVAEVFVMWDRTVSVSIFAVTSFVCVLVCSCLKVETMGEELEDR